MGRRGKEEKRKRGWKGKKGEGGKGEVEGRALGRKERFAEGKHPSCWTKHWLANSLERVANA